ncbi:MAG: type IV secretory system conjugative DNA transfer family protein, partial [Defluviimonas sp.]|nr:type IV secretory system conjugative DNA transfer family protein [Defluviimonas sp.]
DGRLPALARTRRSGADRPEARRDRPGFPARGRGGCCPSIHRPPSSGQNNAILDNCHVRVSFATNDERTAKRVSDALGTATEMKAMRNYAGHRLAPWLGHLMVSRSETARQILTPGEIMQMPPDDEIVMVAGSPPIRAKKARYFEDSRFVDRVGAPPEPRKGDPVRQHDPWSSLPTIEADTPVGASTPLTNADEANAGLRREPDLPEHVAAAPEKTAEPASEFEMMLEDEPEEAARQRQALRKQMGQPGRKCPGFCPCYVLMGEVRIPRHPTAYSSNIRPAVPRSSDRSAVAV